MATKDVAEEIDYAALENVFSAEAKEVKKPNIGMLYIYIHPHTYREFGHSLSYLIPKIALTKPLAGSKTFTANIVSLVQ